jgi:VWFA-related protein
MRCFGLLRLVLCITIVMAASVFAQQNIPDAPKPKVPTQPDQFPDNAPPAPANAHPEPTPATQPAPASAPQPSSLPQSDLITSRNDLPRVLVVTNFVQVPVTVTDPSGHLVSGLGPKDFSVYEDGVRQQLKFFTSDPFPISAAVVLNTDLPASTLRKVNETLPALIGAFSDFDEVALYRYGHTVQQVSTFTGAGSISTTTIAKIKRPGREGGPPMIGGPLGVGSGPSINGHEAVPGQTNNPQAPPPIQEAFVLNDAILRAAQDLSHRDKARRRIIFVISDGRESGSTASYDQVRKVLLSNNIAVYAMGVDTAAIPIYDRLNRVRLPGFGYGNILPRYVSDTAGQMYAAFDRGTIEQAYGRLTDMARNQYTLGYTTRATASSAYRTIEVRVHRPNLTVTAKQGYYPLPPQRPQAR